MKNIKQINYDLDDYVNELERELFSEFISTFRFWDYLFSVELALQNNKIIGINVKICGFGNIRCYFTPDNLWSYHSRKENDYAETIIKVLNRIG